MVFYFWQNMPAMHQVPYQRELAAQGHRVTLCVDRVMLPERAAMGWIPQDTSGLELHVGLSREASMRLLRESPTDSVHFISGVRGVNHGGELTCQAGRLGRRVCWINEAWDTRGAKGRIRSLLYAVEAIRYRAYLKRVFAMGEMGVQAYLRAGYVASQIVEFNYVVPYAPTARMRQERGNPFVFGYVGSLIPRKRADLLLRALSSLPVDAPEWVVEIHGDGPERDALEKVVVAGRIAGRVRWRGRFDSTEAPTRMAGLDALVLPSDFDGWGAVVNEALMCGVPVVASDACGAACVPERHGWGRVFRAGDVISCAQACLAVLRAPPSVNPAEVNAAIGPRATATRLIEALRDA